jgi:ATP-binding cassette subfamily B protein
MGFSQVAGQALYLDDLFSFFEIEPEIVSPPNPRPFPVPIREGFTFENVGFRYPGAEHWAVRNLAFRLVAGEVLALVGENGAGKTTLVKLLARPLRSGRRTDPAGWARFARVRPLRAAQQYRRDLPGFRSLPFDLRPRTSPLAASRRATIVRASSPPRSAVLADDVIRKLPRGYDQVLGKRFRTGIDLSGGEWQKVAIARAYMRDAQLLILDEPTAALDARAEFEVFQRFKELSRGKTAVLISHRFSSVRMADRIVVLVDGAIEAIGTHAELLARGGRYAELFELQAAGYR